MTDIGKIAPGQNPQAAQQTEKTVDIPLFLKPFMLPSLKQQPQQDEVILSEGQKKKKPSAFSMFKDLYNIVFHGDKVIEAARQQNDRNYEQLKKEFGIPD